jgi:hypothetical protein
VIYHFHEQDFKNFHVFMQNLDILDGALTLLCKKCFDPFFRDITQHWPTVPYTNSGVHHIHKTLKTMERCIINIFDRYTCGMTTNEI